MRVSIKTNNLAPESTRAVEHFQCYVILEHPMCIVHLKYFWYLTQ